MSLVENAPAEAGGDTSAAVIDTSAATVTETPQSYESSVDSELSAIWDKHNPSRDVSGRFQARGAQEPQSEAPAAEAQTEATDQPVQTEATSEAAKPVVEPPVSWSAEMKAKFAALPPDVQAYAVQRDSEANKRISELGQVQKTFEPVRSTLERYSPLFEANGVTYEAGLQNLLSVAAALQSDAPNAIREIARRHGVDLRELAGAAPADDGQPDSAELRSVKQELAELRRHVAETSNRVVSREQAEQQAQVSSLTSAIETFASDKPDFDKIEADIAGLIPAIKAANPGLDHKAILEQAYERAIWANPETRARRLEADAKAQADRQAKEARERAEKAKKSASINVKGDVVNGNSPRSVDDDLREIAAKHYGTSRR
jgi:DNA repair exonuclease SbcCD ATPase subunit